MFGWKSGWMDGKMEEQLDEQIDGEEKVKTGKAEYFHVHQEMMDYYKQLLRVLSHCGVCVSHCCGASHLSQAQTLRV